MDFTQLNIEAPTLERGPDLVFSLLDETVWVSWPGKCRSVELGDCDSVIEMMRDFLAQCELGKRLVDRAAGNG